MLDNPPPPPMKSPRFDWFQGGGGVSSGGKIDLNSLRMQTQFYFLVGEPGEAPQMSSKSNSL